MAMLTLLLLQLVLPGHGTAAGAWDKTPCSGGAAAEGAASTEGECDAGNVLLQTRHKLEEGSSGPPPPLCPELASVPAFVLNLDRRADRLRSVSDFLRRRSPMPWLAAQTCRVSAPDGQALGERLRPELVTAGALDSAQRRDAAHEHTNGTFLTVGGTALILGHARMWEHVLRTNASWAILMEDDVSYFSPQLEPLLCLLISEGFNAPALVGEASEALDGMEELRRSVAAMDPDWDYVSLSPCGRHAEPPLRVEATYRPCTGMYIITRGAARRALEGIFPVGGRAQHVQLDAPRGFFRSGMKFYTALPRPVMQGGGGATDVQIGLTQDAPPPEALPQGVSFDRLSGAYQANIRAKSGKFVFLGEFATPEAAHQRYLEAVPIHCPEKKIAPDLVT